MPIFGGELFRSETMKKVQLVIQAESAHDILAELGRVPVQSGAGEATGGVIEFVDMNQGVNAFQRTFVSEVRRTTEMQRQLRFLEEEMRKAELDTEAGNNSTEYAGVERRIASMNATERLDYLEDIFNGLVEEVKAGNTIRSQLERQYQQLTENRHVVLEAGQYFDVDDFGAAVDIRDNGGGESESLLGGSYDPKGGASSGHATGSYPKAVQLGFVTGVIARTKVPLFERTVWRATRGNMLFRQSAIDEPIYDAHTGSNVDKNMFIIFFQGDRLRHKISKLSDAAGATLYACPDSHAERQAFVTEVDAFLAEMDRTLDAAFLQRRALLGDAATKISTWSNIVADEKGIFHTMNKFKADMARSGRTLIAQGWIPEWADEIVQSALERGTLRSGAAASSVFYVLETRETPPTFFKTNKYTYGFQSIVDAYGMARYKEVNPGLFTIITFPWLFGIMFGDLGHGTIMLIFALLLVAFEKKLGKMNLSEMVKPIYYGRYVILLMALFAVYTGVLYNDCFALSFDFFGSNIHFAENGTGYYTNVDRTYPFGIDPGWAGTTNKLKQYNSIKMKLSIVCGVLQMYFGIMLSFKNHRYFNKTIDIICGFIPQMIFLSSLFGYMVFLIFLKWVTYWGDKNTPPLILSSVISMFLHFGSPIDYKDSLYDPALQGTVQTILVILIGVSLPWMLVPKLVYLKCTMKKPPTDEERAHEAAGQRRALLGPAGSTNGGDDFDGVDGMMSSSSRGVAGVRSALLGDDDDMVNASADSSDSDNGGGVHGHGGGDAHASHADGGGHGGDGDHDEEHEDFSEILVHQVIHTIEFALGVISHTASYLRLWALSLAHAELAEVFWDQIFFRTLSMRSFYMIFFGFGAWAGATVGVLMIMESLSAFLHALRLHWVEFNSKFYVGDGRKFIAFNLNKPETIFGEK